MMTKVMQMSCKMHAVACFKWEAAKSENVFHMEKWSSAEA